MPSPNEQQILYWNEQAGPRWVAMAESLDRELASRGLVPVQGTGHSSPRQPCEFQGTGHSSLP